MHARTVGAEQLIQHLTRKTSARKDERLGSHFLQRKFRAVRQWVTHANHESQSIAVNVMYLEIWRFHRQGNDTHIDASVFDALQNRVAEIEIDADVHERIAALKFREHVGKNVQTGGFISAKHHRSLNDVAAIGHNLNGLIAQAQQTLCKI